MAGAIGGVFHPLFAYHARPSIESSQQALVNVYAPTGGTAEWTPGVGMANTTTALVWTGYARIQPDKDWRARARDHGNEFNAVQAVRVQLGIGKNLLGAVKDATGKITAYGVDPEFKKDFVVCIQETNITGTEGLVGQSLTVRNTLTSTVPWSYKLLCDTGTK